MATNRKFDRELLVLHSVCKSVNIALNPQNVAMPKECQTFPSTIAGYLNFIGAKMSGPGDQAAMIDLAERNGLLVELTLVLEDNKQLAFYSHSLFAAMRLAIMELRQQMLVV